jgi:transposase InsO family protein
MVATLVRTIFEQPDAAWAWAQHARVVEQLTQRFPAAAEHLADAATDVLAFTGFPGLDDLELATLEWVDWFNRRRLYHELGRIPPAEFEDHYYGQNISQARSWHCR